MVELIHERYRIEESLGQGGMGVVYRGYDLLLDRHVAIKVLSSPRLGTAGNARLLSEAQAAARLNHPNIMTVHDAGQMSGTPYIVMELLEGETLRQYRPKDLAEVSNIIWQICAGLEHAHAAGIIHRDLKLENVMRLPSGIIKLMDFGLACSSKDSNGVADDLLVGTLLYMAPELLMSDPASVQTDLYALGVMFYELTCSGAPFKGDDLSELISQQLQSEPQPPREINPLISAAMEALILQMLAKQPADRPGSAAEVSLRLDAPNAPGILEKPPMAKNNLPRQLTSFIGRTGEVDHLIELVRSHPLVTVTGSGGTGKTRLVLRAVEDIIQVRWQEFSGLFQDGVCLVELAPLADPTLIPQTCLNALQTLQEPGMSALNALTHALQDRQLLLILDNCEHVTAAAASLVETLLQACPELHILATSREILSVPGEAALRVLPLTFPDVRSLPSQEDLMGFDAVQLFTERARQVFPEFCLTAQNADAVAQICRRLDGIPLALELAAARLRLLSVEQLAARLDHTFRLLAGGSRSVLPRQQTLKAAIDWSYNLLSPQERLLFDRLSVFVGGWTLEAAETVCADGVNIAGEELLDLLGGLLDKSLIEVKTDERERRYRMLETLRQYGRDRMLESGESEMMFNRHLTYFAEFSKRAEYGLRHPGMYEWMERLDLELDNLRSAMEWAGQDKIELGMQIAADLHYYVNARGCFAESVEWAVRLLAAEEAGRADGQLSGERALQRARQLRAYRWEAHHANALSESAKFALGQEAQKILRSLNPLPRLELAILLVIGERYPEIDAETGALLLREQDDFYLGEFYFFCALKANEDGDLQAMQKLLEKSYRHTQASGFWDGTATRLMWLADPVVYQGRYADAEVMLTEALCLERRAKNHWGEEMIAANLPWVAAVSGDYPKAIRLTMEVVEIAKQSRYHRGPGGMTAILIATYWSQGNYASAMAVEQTDLYGDHANSWGAMFNFGRTRLTQGDLASAETYFRRGLSLLIRPLDTYFGVDRLGVQGQATVLQGLAALLARLGRLQESARLFGAGERVYTQTVLGLIPRVRSEHDEILAEVRSQLSAAAFEFAWQAGEAMNPSQSIRWADGLLNAG
jgi:predicted ATPase